MNPLAILLNNEQTRDQLLKSYQEAIQNSEGIRLRDRILEQLRDSRDYTRQSEKKHDAPSSPFFEVGLTGNNLPESRSRPHTDYRGAIERTQKRHQWMLKPVYICSLHTGLHYKGVPVIAMKVPGAKNPTRVSLLKLAFIKRLGPDNLDFAVTTVLDKRFEFTQTCGNSKCISALHIACDPVLVAVGRKYCRKWSTVDGIKVRNSCMHVPSCVMNGPLCPPNPDHMGLRKRSGLIEHDWAPLNYRVRRELQSLQPLDSEYTVNVPEEVLQQDEEEPSSGSSDSEQESIEVAKRKRRRHDCEWRRKIYKVTHGAKWKAMFPDSD